MNVVTDPVDTFGIALPPEWVRFPLGGGDFEEFVRVQRARLASEADLSRTAQRQFELVMRQLRNDCGRANITMVAVMLATIDAKRHDGDHGDPDLAAAGLLSATLHHQRHDPGLAWQRPTPHREHHRCSDEATANLQ